MSESYNMFGKVGSMIRDPRFTFKLVGGVGEVFGDTDLQDIRYRLEWLVHNEHGISLGAMEKYCLENNPSMLIWDSTDASASYRVWYADFITTELADHEDPKVRLLAKHSSLLIRTISHLRERYGPTVLYSIEEAAGSEKAREVQTPAGA